MQMTPEQKALFDALTPLQKEVCGNVLAGMKPVDAYKASSGKAKTTTAITSCVSEMMDRPAVAAFMEVMQVAAVSAAIMTREEAMERLTAIGRASIKDIARFRKVQVGEDKSGEPVYQSVWEFKDDDEIQESAALLVSEVSTSKDGLKLKLHSQLGAIQQLAKMQGWESATKHEHSGPNGGDIQHGITISFVSANESKG